MKVFHETIPVEVDNEAGLFASHQLPDHEFPRPFIRLG